MEELKEENQEIIKEHDKQKIKFKEYLDAVFKQKPNKKIPTYKDLKSENKFFRFIRKGFKLIRKIVAYVNPFTRLFNWIFNKVQFLLGNKNTYEVLKDEIVKTHLGSSYEDHLLSYLCENFPKNGINLFDQNYSNSTSFKNKIKELGEGNILIDIANNDEFKKIEKDFIKAKLKNMNRDEKSKALNALAESKNIKRVEIPEGSGKFAQYRIIEQSNQHQPKGVVFFYHANLMNIYSYEKEEIQKRFPDYIVVMPEYVGYPGSDGYSNKENVKKGLRELQEYIIKNEQVVQDNIGEGKDVIFAGASLGGAYAAKGARQLQESRNKEKESDNEDKKIYGEGKIHLALANTYSKSMNAIPIVPRTIVQGLTYDVELNTNKELKKIDPNTNLVIYHSSNDEMFGNIQENARKNLRTSQAINKNLIVNKGGGHCDVDWGKIVDKIENNNKKVSIKRCLKPEPLNQISSLKLVQ